MTNTETEMPTTPAGEALKNLNKYMHKDKTFLAKSECIVGWVVNNADTIREALSLLDQVQRGEAKVLRREPTDDMVWVKVSAPGQIETKNPVWARAAWKAMYDAAPPKPEGRE